MAKKEYTYRGKTLDELKNLSLQEFMQLIPSQNRRSLKRGLTEPQKALLKKIKAGKKNIKTHVRDLVILPQMIGTTLKLYRGNEFEQITLTQEMIGHYLGEYSYTRKKVAHNAPGIGATRSSASVSVK